MSALVTPHPLTITLTPLPYRKYTREQLLRNLQVSYQLKCLRIIHANVLILLRFIVPTDHREDPNSTTTRLATIPTHFS